MASSLPVRQGSNRPRETDVDRVRTTSSKDMVQFVLHTGAAQPFRVLVVTAGNTYEMDPEDLRLWKSKYYKANSSNYQYRYYNDVNNNNAFQTTESVPLLHSSSGLRVNRDVLFPNIPSAYLYGVALHLEDIFASVNEESIYVKITEMMHLLFQGPGKIGRLQDLLSARNEDEQTNILLSWIIQAIRTATSSSQVSFLSILVAHLDSDTDIIEMFDSEDLRKLICNLHVTPKCLLSRLKTEPQLEAFVMEVLKTLDEFHWVYIVLYCYPLFGAQTILNYTSKVNRDRPPSRTCISDTVLPRLNSHGSTSRNTMKIVEKIKQMQEKEGQGSNDEEKAPSAPGKYGKESAISPQTSSSFSHEGTEVTALNATTSRESALWSKDVSEERSASEKVGEKNVQAESPQAVASSSTCEALGDS